jgi:hypothetical protein
MALYAVNGPALTIDWVEQTYKNACNVPVPLISSSGLYGVMLGQIAALSYPTTGTFDVNLPQGDYIMVMVAPLSSQKPTAMLTSGYLLGVGVNYTTETQSISSTTTGETTLKFFTTLEVPFTQTYGSWIVAAIIGVLILGFLFVNLRMKKHQA